MDGSAAPVDPKVPVALLLSSESAQVLDVLLSEVGASVLKSRVAQVRYVPGRSAVVQYEAEVDRGGVKSAETLVVSAGLDIHDHLPQLEVDGHTVSVWRYPDDPYLPGLKVATDRKRVGKLLGDLGSPQPTAQLRRRTYRPSRRAVIEAITPTTRLFIKVVRPSKVGAIQAKHEALAPHLPVPHSHGWSADLGLVALEAMKGKTLRKTLEGGSRRLPEPEAIVGLLDSLPDIAKDGDVVAGPVAAVGRHAKLLRAIAPHLGDEIESIVDDVSSVSDVQNVAVHGDFHSAQVLVRGSDIVGLVDVDTAGAGQRSDDFAGLLGQLSTMALNSSKRKTINGYARFLMSSFDEFTSPKDLRLRTAAVTLGFATGPFRVQNPTWPSETERRIKLAAKWVISASTLDSPDP